MSLLPSRQKKNPKNLFRALTATRGIRAFFQAIFPFHRSQTRANHLERSRSHRHCCLWRRNSRGSVGQTRNRRDTPSHPGRPADTWSRGQQIKHLAGTAPTTHATSAARPASQSATPSGSSHCPNAPKGHAQADHSHASYDRRNAAGTVVEPFFISCL